MIISDDSDNPFDFTDSLSVEEFNNAFGFTNLSRFNTEQDINILSDEGMLLMSNVFLSVNATKEVFALSKVLQNRSPECDTARGLIYDTFLTLLTLHTELMRIFHESSPDRSRLN